MPPGKPSYGTAVTAATGEESFVTPTGEESFATPTGEESFATPTGEESFVTPTGEESFATPTRDLLSPAVRAEAVAGASTDPELSSVTGASTVAVWSIVPKLSRIRPRYGTRSRAMPVIHSGLTGSLMPFAWS
jgi:hypothetical protein